MKTAIYEALLIRVYSVKMIFEQPKLVELSSNKVAVAVEVNAFMQRLKQTMILEKCIFSADVQVLIENRFA